MPDVVIVGAGLAGLQAARSLAAAGIDDVVILEARNRVGGRLENGRVNEDTVVELGGQWIGETQDTMYELVADLGLETFPTYNRGEHVIELGGKRTRMASHRGAIPKLNPFVLLDIQQGLTRLERLAQRTPLARPWTAPDARRLDGQTFETWIDRTLKTPTGRAYFRIATEAVFSAESTDLSLLHVLFYVHSGTDFETLISTDEGAQRDRVVGGTARIAEVMADQLGDRVRLGQVVRRIHHGDGGATVHLEGGAIVEGRAVIVTLPPTLAGRLVYEPALPSWRDQLTQRLPAGSVMKLFAIYDRPFWRDDGLTGQAVSDTGPVKVTFDNSPPSGTPGILLGFTEANDGRRMARATPEERRRATLDAFARLFGPAARDPIAFLERDWMAERFTRGCYGAHFTPGVWTAYGPALREPIGPIHWAGAETSTVWNGYMEGAVRSGVRAADEVLGHLRRASSPGSRADT